MSHYSSAYSKLVGYTDAITSIKLARSTLEETSEELNKIEGVDECEDLKSKIIAKIDKLDTVCSSLTSTRSRILQKARDLDRIEEEKRLQESKGK